MLEASWKFFDSCTRRDFLRAAGALGLGVAAQQLPRVYARSLGGPSELPLPATLKIDLERRLGTIDPNIYGNFIEHLGRCIYGGIYDEGSPLADADGNRTDVLEAARKLRVTQLRWPGGNFGSGYHWQDGIGPKDARPARYDLAWFERESNRFGTDEFISTCRKLGTAPYIGVNIGTGTIDEASSWVEYCNRQGGTYFSDLRKKNGHPEPYAVKYWGIGNEIYGDWQIGHKNAADYAKMGLEFAKVMKWQDPSIKLVACGTGDPSWDQPVLESMVQSCGLHLRAPLHGQRRAEGLLRDPGFGGTNGTNDTQLGPGSRERLRPGTKAHAGVDRPRRVEHHQQLGRRIKARRRS